MLVTPGSERVKNGLSLTAKWPIIAGAYPGFRSMK